MENIMEEAGLSLGDLKATKGMRESLSNLLKLLRCPLCDKLFDQPTTLASCAHSFCVTCIDSYCCGSWVCPVEGCSMPMSITGGHRGSYRKINPQLSQTVESLKLICKSLNQAPDGWWKTAPISITTEGDPPSANLDQEEAASVDENENESDGENMVDLQMHEAIEESSESGNDESEWEN